MLPRGSVGKFLHSLAEDPEGEHSRWEPKDLIPRPVGKKYRAEGLTIRERNRFKKQLSEDPGGVPDLSELNRGARIYPARKRSIRCRFMLFDIPKGFRKDQFLSLYRSIIIFDLINIHKLKTWQIAQSIVNKSMSEYVDKRGISCWEYFSGKRFENEPILRLLEGKKCTESEDYLLESMATRYFQQLFTNISDTSKSLKKDALGGDKYDHLRKIDQEIIRYLRRAEDMAYIASYGRFATFPSFLKSKKTLPRVVPQK